MHPVANFVIAKALERAHAEHLSYALGELRDSFGKLRRMYSHTLANEGSLLLETRIGVLRALIERAATLSVLEGEVCEVSLCHIFSMRFLIILF
jgi:nucleolar protein 9